KSDSGLISMYAADDRVARGTRSIPHPLPPGTTEGFIERSTKADRTEDVWVIDGKATDLGEMLGIVSLERMDRGQSEIFFWVAPAFWGTGIASGAVKALIEANPHDAKTLFAEVFQDNLGSARVLTNCGFTYLGDAEAYSVARKSTVPTWTYTLKINS
ncbi:GNAT family N-acetyltransferase, partial [Marivivens donghaensis]|uniref:GNAT family N-acetyltransferase n=1 Tax=Marivivens donghaensis TaxID=1699413 RepID=UPI003F6A35EA